MLNKPITIKKLLLLLIFVGQGAMIKGIGEGGDIELWTVEPKKPTVREEPKGWGQRLQEMFRGSKDPVQKGPSSVGKAPRKVTARVDGVSAPTVEGKLPVATKLSKKEVAALENVGKPKGFFARLRAPWFGPKTKAQLQAQKEKTNQKLVAEIATLKIKIEKNNEEMWALEGGLRLSKEKLSEEIAKI